MPEKLISIVVPAHNEQHNIKPLYARVKAVFDGLPEYQFELIFCDDSTDGTPQEIARIHALDGRVKLIRLSRRFSQAVAISAGLDRATGVAAILMDADLQDPPEAIPRLLELWQQGNEIVYAERQSGSDYVLYKVFAKIFYRLMRRMASPEIPLDAGEFRLLDRKAVIFLQSLTERTRFLRGLTVWPGLRQARIRIERAARASGKTNYNFRRSLVVAIDGLTTFSVVPLRAVAIAGLVILTISAVAGMALGTMGRWREVAIASIWFLGGVQLLFLGVVAEYVGRIFVEVQNRPLYWVDYELGFPPRDRVIHS